MAKKRKLSHFHWGPPGTSGDLWGPAVSQNRAEHPALLNPSSSKQFLPLQNFHTLGDEDLDGNFIKRTTTWLHKILQMKNAAKERAQERGQEKGQGCQKSAGKRKEVIIVDHQSLSCLFYSDDVAGVQGALCPKSPPIHAELHCQEPLDHNGFRAVGLAGVRHPQRPGPTKVKGAQRGGGEGTKANRSAWSKLTGGC
ncbi:unnamed protein product [Pleuronectes platessa]|uniref:Uncharacterized protein n=1 Tax=Pleuronectes platessa TaxID=8262 RepID=A0A9N7VB64_PLEPL|nr:unnamed protein product [Pleuronectes platessa]